MIASNKALESLATNKPTTIQQLKIVNGIGPKIVERYGEEIIGLTREHLGVVSVPDERDQKIKTFLESKNVSLDESDIAKLRVILEQD